MVQKINTKLRLYNTLSGKKELFKPRTGRTVNLFVCGPTVYDFPHIGHARTYIFFDVFVKYLKSLGFKTFYLQNITDVDDKIILRAREKGVLPKNLAMAFEKEYLKDMTALLVTSVNTYARATDYIKEIIGQVRRLLEKGYAYTLEDGIYFDILKFKDYGKLSHRAVLENDDSISRIDYSKYKKNRGDFCLWKLKDSDEGPSWKSPFGEGRPGWHIEDTAITEKFFGSQYDIHGGGRDLIFPHHEAEITQMEALSGKKPLAQYWMHTGFLTINGQKMSKSLNNFTLINSFLARYPVEMLRFWFLKNLWRSPVDYSESTMLEIRSALEKIEEFLRKINSLIAIKQSKEVKPNGIVKKYREDFYNELADDFNTPKAFGVIFLLIKDVNKIIDEHVLPAKDAKEIYKFFEEINEIFNVFNFKKVQKSNVPDEVKVLVEQREDFRRIKEWEKADEMRIEIEKYGYTVEDTVDGPLLKKK